MVFFYPVESVADKEVFYFIFAVIKDFCAPVRVLALSRICVFIERLTVEVGKSVGNLRGKLNKSVIDNSFQTRYNEILSEIMRMWRNWQTHQP